MPRSDAKTPPALDPSPSLTKLVVIQGRLTLDRIFTPDEARLVEDVETFAGTSATYAADLKKALRRGLRNLGSIALALESYPSLRGRDVLGDKERSFETLLRTLVEGGEHGLEWVVPTKAVLARTYGIAKVNFFSSLKYVVEASRGPAAAQLRDRLAAAVEEAVHSRLAEELYAGFITSRTTRRRVKEIAAQHLIDLWDGRVGLVTRRFCPLLRSAWTARTRAPRVFGTLVGVQEMMQLLFADCDQRFVDHFARHAQDLEQRQAFEEFLFDLAFEDLERVRLRMLEEGRSCVGPREVETYLGFGEGRLRPLVGGPKALYVSFRRRRVKAQYRTSMGTPGPKRTAEAYLLEALLEEEAEQRAITFEEE
jgi:hypothetical protein